jgi:hypothetical protein
MMSAQRFALVARVCLLTVLSSGRLRAATVTLADADVQGLKFVTDVDAATLRIPLETDADVKELSVSVDDFVGPGGTLAPAVLTLGDAPLKGPLALKQLERPVLQPYPSRPTS